MNIEFGPAKSLQAVLRNDLTSLDRLQDELIALQKPLLSPAEAVQLAYLLHNIYCALENSFEQITRTFENHVVNRDRWHQELLAKMFLDLSPLRPAVLPPETKPLLRDMLGFRHLFRHAYDYTLDHARVNALGLQWLAQSTLVRSALGDFAEELGRVAPE